MQTSMRQGLRAVDARREIALNRRKKRSLRVKRYLLDKGGPVFKSYGVSTVILFGSVLQGRSRPQSDIDILALSVSAADYWDFKHDLEEALDLPVDLYTQADDPVFVKKIRERGETVYAA